MRQSYIFRVGLTAAAGLALASGRAHAAIPLTSGSYTTPAASSELAAICPNGTGYPQAWGWAGFRGGTPASATKGQPRIDQVRQGKVIATYTSFSDQPGCTQAGDGTDYLNPAAPAASGCGPFTREHTWRMWAPGDVFLVYPAVYAGPYNQPWIGPEYDGYAAYNAGITHTPDNITIQGVVQNNTRPVILLQGAASNNTLGQAPVYFDASNGFTMDSVNISAAPRSSAGKAGLYELGASNLTLSNMRITDFVWPGVNGLFGAGGYGGTLTLTALELDHNGSSNGPAHNAYIGASQIDPNFTVILSHSWSHDAFYGHLFKSRAQNNVITANFFQGGVPLGIRTQAEAYLLDVPNGGNLAVRNNIFVKNASGSNSNGMSLTFLMEGYSDSRPQSLDVENNTFVTFVKTYDGSHANYPLSFFYPNIRPDGAAWPSTIPTRVIKNAFVGYCAPGDGGPQDYRGDITVIESFSELTRVFALVTKVSADDATLATIYSNYVPETGTPAYTNSFGVRLLRKLDTVGAED